MRVEESIYISARREEVWPLVSDPRRMDEFMDGVRYWTVPGEPVTGFRARFATRMRVGSAEIGGVVEVIEFDPPHEVAWTSITGIDQRGRWILRSIEGGTKVTLRFGYQAPGGILAVIASRIGAPMVRGHIRRSLVALKRLLEED